VTRKDSTAAATYRSGYKEVLRLVDAQAVDVVLCWKWDRFIREPLDLECLLSAVLVDPPAPTGQVPAPTGQVPAPTGQVPAPTGQVVGWTPPENMDGCARRG
jgi:hypothetical protein